MGASPTLFVSGRLAQGGWGNGEKGQPVAMEGSVLLPGTLFLLGSIWGKAQERHLHSCPRVLKSRIRHMSCICFPRVTTQTKHLGVAMSPIPAGTPSPGTAPRGSQRCPECLLRPLCPAVVRAYFPPRGPLALPPFLPGVTRPWWDLTPVDWLSCRSQMDNPHCLEGRPQSLAAANVW